MGRNFPKEFWDENKEDIIRLYITQTLSTYKIADKYNTTPVTIRNHLKLWGVYDNKLNFKKKNIYEFCNNYIVGKTRTVDYEFYIDSKHYDMISQYCWHKHQDGYLRTCIGHKPNGGNIYKLMHVMIMEAEGYVLSSGEEVDHINGKPNDNRLENLRIVTHEENMKNVKLPINNLSGCKGVYYSNRERKWKAAIRVNKKQKHLGTFETKEEAIAIRQKAEEQYYGEYKRKNEDLYNGTR